MILIIKVIVMVKIMVIMVVMMTMIFLLHTISRRRREQTVVSSFQHDLQI